MKNVWIIIAAFIFFIGFLSSAASADLQTEYVQSGDALFSAGSFAKAKEEYMKAVPIFQGIKKDPNPYSELWYKVSLCDMSTGKYEQALSNLETASLYATDPVLKKNILLEKGDALVYLRRFSEAELNYQNAGMSSDAAKNRVNEYIRLYETNPGPAIRNESPAINTTPLLQPEITTPAISLPPESQKTIPDPLSLSLAGFVIGFIILVSCGLLAIIIYRKTRASGQPGREPGGAATATGQETIPALSPPEKRPGHHDVFISNAPWDKPVSDAVCAALEARGIRCWMVPRDVSPGENYPEAVIRAIEESRVMVLIFSAHSNESLRVIRELTKAVSMEMIIIPFRIEDVPLSRSMEYLIGLPHWLDAMTPPLEQHIAKLAETIIPLLKNDT
ncbi:MAG: TIR domain-containing protein [Methanoregula sp.]